MCSFLPQDATGLVFTKAMQAMLEESSFRRQVRSSRTSLDLLKVAIETCVFVMLHLVNVTDTLWPVCMTKRSWLCRRSLHQKQQHSTRSFETYLTFRSIISVNTHSLMPQEEQLGIRREFRASTAACVKVSSCSASYFDFLRN